MLGQTVMQMMLSGYIVDATQIQIQNVFALGERDGSR